MSREKNIFEKFPKKWPKGPFGKPVRGERGNHDLPSGADKLRTAKGKVVNDFRTPMLQPKVSEFLLFSSDADYTLRNKQTMLLLNMALNNRYLKSIREEKGGTYGVQVSYTL